MRRLTYQELNALRIALGMFIANIKNDGPTKRHYISVHRKVQAECARRERPWRYRFRVLIGWVVVLSLLGAFATLLRIVR